ncbi:MAG: glycerol kinase GlpK [Fusobacteriaceae bacterium]
MKYIIALDQGTTSSRAIIFDEQQRVIASSQKEFKQIYPKEGWVEHDPMEIWSSQSGVLAEAMAQSGISQHDVIGIGITNQRETTIVWNKITGKPVYNAIVWQCRRTAQTCDDLKEKGLTDYIRENTGLVVDAYFSGTKIKWILDNVEGARESAERGELLFGTVDTWLIWKLTNGKSHYTDYTNASRTMIYNIKDLCWDEKLLSELNIPKSMLPTVKDSSGTFGYANLGGQGGHRVPICGVAGDQQAALFGQACFEKGEAKNTYGTGCFMLMNTGEKMYSSKNGLLTTIAIGLNGKVEYALEGSIFVAGAAVQWLRDELKLIEDSKDTEYFANQVKDNGGVYFVPAFVGLGTPNWDMYARGTIVGLTRGSNKNHIIRATLESIAYQAKDVLEAMQQDSGIELKALKVDGGASANNFLMQFQSDIIGKEVHRPSILETTALGAAYLAGLAVGFWNDKNEIKKNWCLEKTFIPNMSEEDKNLKHKKWKRAVERSLNWDID